MSGAKLDYIRACPLPPPYRALEHVHTSRTSWQGSDLTYAFVAPPAAADPAVLVRTGRLEVRVVGWNVDGALAGLESALAQMLADVIEFRAIRKLSGDD